MTAGERGGRKIAHLDYDNSPLSFLEAALAGKQLVLTTSNGTACLLAASSNPAAVVMVGALLNATAVAKAALTVARQSGIGISVVIAGRKGGSATEDQIAASEIAAATGERTVFGQFKLVKSDDFERDFLDSDSGRNLVSLGRRDDVVFCAKKEK